MIIHSKNHQYHARRKEIIGYPKKKIITKTIPKKEYRRGYHGRLKRFSRILAVYEFRNRLRKSRRYQT